MTGQLGSRETQVTRQINHMTEALGELEAVSEELTSRLIRVCSTPLQTAAMKDAGIKVPEEILVPLADDIRKFETRLRQTINALRILLGSIEI